MTSDNTPVLRARQTPAVAPQQPTQAGLDVQMQKAHAISKAGDACPKGYRGSPGAVLLAMEWATHHDVDLLTTMQSVVFVQGRPVIDATMIRALAQRAGYRIALDASPSAATARVLWNGEELGRATFDMDDAKRAGLTGKDNWKNYAEDMLVARATSRAVRRFAPEVMMGLAVPEEVYDTDPVAVLTQPEPDADPVTGEIVEGDAAVVLSEEASAAPSPEPENLDGDEQPITDTTKEAVRDAIAQSKSQGSWPAISQQLQDAGLPLQPHRMTEECGQFVIELVG